MSRIDVHIDALVLDGVGHIDRDAFAASLEGAIARLVGDRGLPGGSPRDGAVQAVDAPAPGEPNLGAAIASAIYGAGA